jgi:hypothetical protein
MGSRDSITYQLPKRSQKNSLRNPPAANGPSRATGGDLRIVNRPGGGVTLEAWLPRANESTLDGGNVEYLVREIVETLDAITVG